jgi:hypothetical protein
MYDFFAMTRDIVRNDNSTYILGAGPIYSEQFKKQIGKMMYSQCLHDLNLPNNLLYSRSTITAFFNDDRDSITLGLFYPASDIGQIPGGSVITKTVVLYGTGAYGHVNSTNSKLTLRTNGNQRYAVVDPIGRSNNRT